MHQYDITYYYIFLIQTGVKLRPGHLNDIYCINTMYVFNVY